MKKLFLKVNWDSLGIASSIACAIHCAVLPLFVSSLPLFGVNIVENKFFEFFMIGLALVLGIVALRHGFRLHHHRYWPLVLFVTGILLLIGKEMVSGHPLWMIIGAVFCIISAHFLNYRLCRKANHCHATDCSH
jgi:hypothetical protein